MVSIMSKLLIVLIFIGCVLIIEDEVIKPYKFSKLLKKYESIKTYRKESLGINHLLDLKDLEKYLVTERLMQLFKNETIEVIDGEQLKTIQLYKHDDTCFIKASDLCSISDYRYVRGYILPKNIRVDAKFLI